MKILFQNKLISGIAYRTDWLVNGVLKYLADQNNTVNSSSSGNNSKIFRKIYLK
jgi:hypothetical protein